MDLIQFILNEMPFFVERNDKIYTLQLYPNGSEDFRFCYADEDNNFIYICENITGTDELIEDLKGCKKWIIDNKYITK